MATIDYTSRLHCTAADGKLALTGEIFDDKQNKFQKQINQEVKTRLDNLGDEIGQKISGVYRPKGSLDFARVMALTPAIGDVYDIPAEFTLNGHKYPAHTNIVATKAAPGENSWDTLGGTVDVQDILSKAATATDSKLQPVSQKATAAEATANAAKKAAETALATSTAASETASSAKTTADAATQTANAAKDTADAAVAQAAKDTEAKVNAAKVELTTLIGNAKVKTIGVKELDNLITADNCLEFIKDPRNAVMVVMGHNSGANDLPVGVLFNVVDSMRHTIEQKFITHYYFKGGKVLEGHQHDILREWTRLFPIVSSMVLPLKPWNDNGEFLNGNGYATYEPADQAYFEKIGLSAADYTGYYPAKQFSPWRCYHDEFLVHIAEVNKASEAKLTAAQSTANAAKQNAELLAQRITTLETLLKLA